MSTNTEYESVLTFWFGSAREDDDAVGRRMSFWFSNRPETDQAIAEHFASAVEAAAAGELAAWRDSPRGVLGLILLLDQFPRNLWRGTAAAFKYDEEALHLCLDGIASAQERELTFIEQVFFMMPLQHAESRSVQQKSVEEFAALIARIPSTRRRHYEGFLKYAHMHNDIVQRFGRFPHRNALLGRADTEEEQQYLAGDAPNFGQQK